MTMMQQQAAPGPDPTPPLFSVIIPFEYHRGQWEKSWLGWQAQTVDKAAYELVLVIPPDFPDRAQLDKLESPTVRVVCTDDAHDIGLCAAGAASARGKFFFFTESHCWPDPDVLALCLQALRDHPDWDGFSCCSVPVCHNRLSEAEASMYQSDIEFAMTAHPWRKVLDQCFVTRREAYEASGGFRAEFGHFAEWVLAADYHARGYRIGYLGEARLHHYYVGEIGELKTFTLDFVQGEIRYFSGSSHASAGELLEAPMEWVCRDNFDAGMARHVVRTVARNLLADLRPLQLLGSVDALLQWLPRAIFGGRLVRGRSAVAARYARLVLAAAILAGSKESVARRFRIYIAALARYQRLACSHAMQTATAGGTVARPVERISGQSGFHPLEQWRDREFRWSEAAATVRIQGRPGRNTVRIECLDVRRPLSRIGLRFFLDDRGIAKDAIAFGDDVIELHVDLPPSGLGTLAWTCRRFLVFRDRRCLGLPVARLAMDS